MWYDQPTALGEKIAANRQRRHRELYLAGLPSELRAILAAVPTITSPALDDLTESWIVTPEGIGRRSPRRPHGYVVRRFGWPEKLFTAVEQCRGSDDGRPAYFQPAEEQPAYLVEFGWTHRHLRQLVDDCPSSIALVTADLQAGILIYAYIGYVEDDFNPSETAYRLACWPHPAPT